MVTLEDLEIEGVKRVRCQDEGERVFVEFLHELRASSERREAWPLLEKRRRVYQRGLNGGEESCDGG